MLNSVQTNKQTDKRTYSDINDELVQVVHFKGELNKNKSLRAFTVTEFNATPDRYIKRPLKSFPLKKAKTKLIGFNGKNFIHEFKGTITSK